MFVTVVGLTCSTSAMKRLLRPSAASNKRRAHVKTRAWAVPLRRSDCNVRSSSVKVTSYFLSLAMFLSSPFFMLAFGGEDNQKNPCGQVLKGTALKLTKVAGTYDIGLLVCQV